MNVDESSVEMINVQVLGTGCRKCLELEERLGAAMSQSGGAEVRVERIADERIILRHMPLDAIPRAHD